MQKIVIMTNSTFLSLSPKAIRMYLCLCGKECFFYNTKVGIDDKVCLFKTDNPTNDSLACFLDFGDNFVLNDDNTDFIFWDLDTIERDDKNLIKVVEELGDESIYKERKEEYGLKIVEIPDDVKWYVGEYEMCNREYVGEHARTWD